MWSRPLPSRCGRALIALGILSVLASVAGAAPGDIDRLAGAVGSGPALHVAQVPVGLAVRDGALYVSDGEWHVVRRIDLATGSETVAAGAGRGGFSGDGGPATAAQLFQPAGLAFDTAGNLFIADTANHRIRRVDALTGIIETIAGSDATEHAGDGGPATSAGFAYPVDVAVAADGDVFVADPPSQRIRRIDAATGSISTFAGTGESGPWGDGGPATSATFQYPSAIAIDPAGRLLIHDSENLRVRRVEADGTIGTIFFDVTSGYLRDLAVAADGRIWVSRTAPTYVIRVESGAAVAVTGSARGFAGDGGPASGASMESPEGLAIDETGDLFIADRGNRRVRRVDHASGVIRTIAGNGSCCSGGDGGAARDGQVRNDANFGIDGSGNLLTVNPTEPRVRRIDVRSGVLATVAGTGEPGFSGDGGPATAARLASPTAAVGDARGNVWVADTGNARIRRIDGITGVITTVAGTGLARRSNDGAVARTSSIGWPQYLALDRDGNLFFGERHDFSEARCAIRRIDAATGLLGTVVGGSFCIESGNGGPALAAGIQSFGPMAYDPRGGLVFLDDGHVRRVDFTSGLVERLLGNEYSLFTPDGMPAAGASVAGPTGVGVDSLGNVYVAEMESQRVRRIDATTGLLSTVAGNGVEGWDGNGDGGPATLAELWLPAALAVTHSDRIYVGEGFANRIRVVASGPHCGDWTVDPGEGCDDGNVAGGDCCSPTCTLAGAGAVCRAATGECDAAEICDGTNGLCPAPAFVASGTACTSDGNVCTDDACDGAGTCVHANNTAPCSDGAFCNGADSCAGGSCRVHAGNPCFGGPECANACDEARDTCNVVAGLPCTLDDSFCTDDVCDGNGSCAHPPARGGETCRASGGDCDVAEVCDGVSPQCPPDGFRPSTTVCRVATGECDRAESCTGSSPQCPANAFAPTGTSCTPDSSACTADVCDGSGACTHPAGNAGVQCRASAGACDVAESCDGASTTCPPDTFRSATFVCRGAAGECDRAESCSGSSAQCPANAFAPSGASCTPDALPCTSDVCDGSGACTHPAGNAGAVCRSAAGVCDVAEACDGVASVCPPDAFQPTTVVCRSSSGVCDLAETCDGARAACPADAGVADTDDDGACDARDPCTNADGGRDFVSPPRSSLVLTRVGADPVAGDDGLKLTASFTLPEGRSFAELRPHLRGVRLVLEGVAGSRPLDATLPPGAYGAVTRRGWKASATGRTWTYLDRGATPVNGIVKLILTDRGRASAPRQVKVVVTGKRGAYPVAAVDLPLQAILTLGDASDAAAGLCAESAYLATSCAFNGAGNQLVCLR